MTPPAFCDIECSLGFSTWPLVAACCLVALLDACNSYCLVETDLSKKKQAVNKLLTVNNDDYEACPSMAGYSCGLQSKFAFIPGAMLQTNMQKMTGIVPPAYGNTPCSKTIMQMDLGQVTLSSVSLLDLEPCKDKLPEQVFHRKHRKAAPTPISQRTISRHLTPSTTPSVHTCKQWSQCHITQ